MRAVFVGVGLGVARFEMMNTEAGAGVMVCFVVRGWMETRRILGRVERC